MSVVQIEKMFDYGCKNQDIPRKRDTQNHFSSPVSFASIAFGCPNANFWEDPNPWLPGWEKSITSKAARQKGKCDDK